MQVMIPQLVFAICTGRFNIRQSHFLPTHYIYVFCADLRNTVLRLFYYSH